MTTAQHGSRFFPPAEQACEEGLLMIGGHLSVDWLTDAYRHGIFPWPVFEDENLLAWWSPDPRAIIPLDGLHVSRRLRRVVRSGKFQVTSNRDFAAVVEACATVDDRRDNTWITRAMKDAFCEYYRAGFGHSVEVWCDGQLAGGVYGVAIGGLFAGESMFHYETDASKVALVHLVAHLNRRGYRLFDIQQLTAHSARMGAIEIPRTRYLQQLSEAVDLPVSFGEVPGTIDMR
ncbi:MAG: leucyl/phenylalanyl-tRNA--protein transferase [Planctomycetales bacterium]|nr:leucyl/phenylalanyl-tRNA--protein transferase [Planctomycetales bacterium]